MVGEGKMQSSDSGAGWHFIPREELWKLYEGAKMNHCPLSGKSTVLRRILRLEWQSREEIARYKRHEALSLLRLDETRAEEPTLTEPNPASVGDVGLLCRHN
jgi:hypothetical protein